MLLGLLSIGGGVALILLGAGELRRALDRLFGTRLEMWIQGLAATRPRAFASGLGFSLLAPSSTTMAMLAIQTVDERLASPRQMLALLLGAGIGLTATIQLVSFRLSAYSPIIVLVGFLLSYAPSAPRARQAGRMIVGLGLIFLGIATVQRALAQGLAGMPVGTLPLPALQRQPLLLVGGALAISLLTQSATATIALAVAVADSNTLPFATALPWVVGANLGIGLTVFFGGYQHAEARRVGFALTLAQALVAFPAALWAGDIGTALGVLPTATARDIANSHTGFNLAVAALGLLLLTPLLQIATRTLPMAKKRATGRYVDSTLPARPAESFTLAVAQARRELLRLGRLVADDFHTSWRGISQNDGAATESVRADRMAASRVFGRLRGFLASLASQEGHEPDQLAEPIALTRALAEVEVLHGAVATDLTRLARRLQDGGIRFSAEGQRELDAFAGEIGVAFAEVLARGGGRTPDAAAQLASTLVSLAERADGLRDRHLARLHRGLPQSLDSSLIHLDVLTFLRLIAEHLAGLVTAASLG